MFETGGSPHFGVEFKELSKVFDRALTEHNNRESVASFIFRLEDIEEHIKELRSGAKGVDTVYKTAQALINKGRGCPEALIYEVSKLMRDRNPSIIIPRQATEEEVKEQEVIQKKLLDRPYYIDEKKGSLKGLEFLYPENDLRDILIKDIESHLKGLAELDVDSASYKDLQFWSKWCGEFDQKIEKVEEILEYGNRLLEKNNLAQLKEFLSEGGDINEFNKWLSKSVLD